LGIISWGSNVRVGTATPNNVTIDAVVMAPNGIFTVDNYDQGAPRGIATLFGGAITDRYGAFGQFSGTTGDQMHGYGRNFVYDARMENGVSPLYFPFMPNYISLDSGLDNRLAWQEG
jgi:hypothetical protein